MKVLLICGSPRKGCTYRALEEVAGTLNKEGIESEIVSIGTKPVRGCIGCGACAKNGNKRCVFDDDILNSILEKAEECDGYVFGSPVYYASANGSMISLMDRLFYSGKTIFEHKPAACVASARRAGTTSTIDQLQKYLTITQMPVVSSTYWPMVHGNCPEDVEQDKEGLQVMRNVAKNMAWLLKCIEAGKKAGIEIPVADAGERTNFIH